METAPPWGLLSRLCGALSRATGMSLKGRQRERSRKRGKKRKQASGDRLMEGAEWLFVFLNAEKWPHVINMTEHSVTECDSRLFGTKLFDLCLMWGNLGVRMSFWFLSFVYLAFSRNTMTLTQTNNSRPSCGCIFITSVSCICVWIQVCVDM